MARKVIDGTNNNDRLEGTAENDIINGFASDDWISGNRGDDWIDGGAGNDRIVDYFGNNEIYGGEGNDQIVGGLDKDIVDGGAGDDTVWTGAGDDTGIYTLAENRNARDYYDGGYGTDTFRLRLTQAELNSAGIQADIEAFRQFITANANANTANGPVFKFTSFDLQLRNWEKLDVEVIDGTTPPTLSIADAQVVEGGALAFTVSVDKADPNASITATYTITFPNGATAADLLPGTALTGIVEIPKGQTQITLQAPMLDDTIFEGTETFKVTLSNLSSNVQSGDLEANGTILDNDNPPTLSISDGIPNPATEGADASIIFTVSLSNPASQPVTVNYATVNGTALAGQDFTGTGGNIRLTFAPGETSKDIVVPVLDDDLAENPEAFTVVLSDAKLNDGQPLTITDASGTGNIVNDDVTKPIISIADAQATEGQTLGFVISVDKADPNVSISATYTITFPDGATVADLLPGTQLTGVVEIPKGETQVTLQVPTFDDIIFEGTETFKVTLSNLSSNVQSGDLEANGTILDIDNPPTLSISDGVTNPATEGTNASIIFTVSLSNPASQPVTVNYTTVNGTALAGQDFTGTGGNITLIFAPGETSEDIVVPVLDDGQVENPEAFTVVLSDAKLNDGQQLTITDASGIGNIVDDDIAKPILSIADAQATEGQMLGFMISVDKADPNAPISATYTITFPDGATVADLLPGTQLTGVVEIPKGETQVKLEVPTLDDSLYEGTETLTVTLTELSANVQAGDVAATGTILDNEPVVSIANASVTEGGTLSFSVTSTLADPNAPITATYTITFPNGATLADLPDGTPLSGPVVIQAGETSTKIQVPTFDDTLYEGVETFTVTLSNLSVNAKPGDMVAIGTIQDNEGFECGYTWGDPHYVTADGLAYDMQGCGEFIFVETSNANDTNPVVVQTRTALYGPNVSVNTAAATLVDGHRVTINTLESQPLRINGVVTPIASGDSIKLGNGQISFNAGVYSIVYPNRSAYS